MTADIINLNKVRKARARADRAAEAAENRVRFGRSKAERKETAAEGEKLRRELDGTRRDPPPASEAAGRASAAASEDADGEDRLDHLLDPGTVS